MAKKIAAEKIKLAIVGCGGHAGYHAQQVHNNADILEVVALCDIKRDHLERYHREKFAGDAKIRLYDSMADLMRDPPAGLRAVSLVTPHTAHFEQSMAALDHGYDVLCEKPMVTCSEHARKLARKIASSGRQFQIAFQAPYTEEFAYIRDVIARGELGELQTVTAYSCQGWRNATTGTWRQDPKHSGGGQMYDSGAHLFNAIAWLIDRPVKEVFCWTDNKGTSVDINAAITIRWEGNVLGSVTISGNTPGWQEGIWVAGDKGRVSTGIHGGRLEHVDAVKGVIKYPQVTQNNYSPLQNFALCLQGKAEPRCGVRYGILHSWLMDALYKSAEEGKPVTLSKPPL